MKSSAKGLPVPRHAPPYSVRMRCVGSIECEYSFASRQYGGVIYGRKLYGCCPNGLRLRRAKLRAKEEIFANFALDPANGNELKPLGIRCAFLPHPFHRTYR